jgi:hypothetical protein
VESVQFIPPAYYVGDRVELRAQVRSSEAEVAAPRGFPEVSWGEFHDARVQAHGGFTEISVFFTAYQTGAQTIPSLVCGDVILEGLSVSVRSLVEEGFRDPAPPHGSLLLPATRLVIAAAAGLLILLPLLAWLCVFRLRPRLAKLARRWRERKPYRRLRRELAELSAKAADMDSRGFYIGLLDTVKLYMHARCEPGCVALTTRELEPYFERRFGSDPDKAALLDIFRFGDEVKFGGRESLREKRLRDAGQAARIAARLETGIMRHAHV